MVSIYMFRLVRPIVVVLLALAGVASAETPRNISFLGSNATGRSVVIVIDHPAEMTRSWRAVCLQIANTLRSLTSDQSFNIVLARESDCLALSRNDLLPATPGNIDNALDMLHGVFPKCRANPIPALELAFRLNPDVIYLLAGKDFAGDDEVVRFCAARARGGAARLHTIAIIDSNSQEIRQDAPGFQCLRDITLSGGGRFHLATRDNLRAETPPDHTLTIRRGTRSPVVEFAPDGRTAYVYANINQVKVWETIVNYWPEIAAAILGLILLATLIRSAGKDQEPGEQYCRRCNYNLRGLPGDQCPECGTTLTPENRVEGRRRRPRFVIATILLICVAVAYVPAATRLPRQGRASQWLDWRSISLADWAVTGKRQWLLRHMTRDDAIVCVDLDRGTIAGVRCRITNPPDGRLYSRMLSPDGRTLLCSVEDGAAAVDCATGKIIRRYDFPCHQAVYTRIGMRAIFGCHMKELAAWDIHTGKQVSAVTLDSDATIGGVLSVAGRDLAVILSEAESGTTVRVWDPLAGTFVQTFNVSSRSCCCDGGRLYAALNADSNLTIETWDLLTGQRQASTPTGQTFPRHPILTAKGDWLAATTVSESETLAINLRTGVHRSWQMRYPLPAISPDGRHLVAGAYCGSGHFDEVRIHDLPQ